MYRGGQLEGALIKLSSVASKLTTASAQDMIRAMIAGERDPHTLAALARTRMKARHNDLVEALAGMSGDHHVSSPSCCWTRPPSATPGSPS